MSFKFDPKQVVELLKKAAEELAIEDAQTLLKSAPKAKDDKENSQEYGTETAQPKWDKDNKKENDREDIAEDEANKMAIKKDEMPAHQSRYHKAKAEWMAKCGGMVKDEAPASPPPPPPSDMSAWSKVAAPASTQNGNWSSSSSENAQRMAQGAMGKAEQHEDQSKLKGVNTQAFHGDKQLKGMSNAGKLARTGSHGNWSKEEHKKVLQEIKDQPKADLPKAELEKAMGAPAAPAMPAMPKPKAPAAQAPAPAQQIFRAPGSKPVAPKASVSVKGPLTAASHNALADRGINVVRKEEANPDEKQDAKLGEDVEHLVEDHMVDNKAAEAKEGHKIEVKKSRYDMAKAEWMKKRDSSMDKPRGYHQAQAEEQTHLPVSESTPHGARMSHRPDSKNPSLMGSKVGVHNYHGAKQEAKAGLERLKASTKADLPKSEMKKSEDQKGVHAGLRSKGGNSQMGQSAKSAVNIHPNKHTPAGLKEGHAKKAKTEAKKVLKELKDQPKPNLPKSEIQKGDLIDLKSKKNYGDKPDAAEKLKEDQHLKVVSNLHEKKKSPKAKKAKKDKEDHLPVKEWKDA